MSSSEERLHDQLVEAAGPVKIDPVALARTAARRGRARRRRRVVASTAVPALAVGAVVAAAVAMNPTPRPSPAPAVTTAPDRPILLSAGEPLLTCNGPERFTPTVARQGLAKSDPAQFVAAMQAHAKAQEWSMPTTLRTPEQIARADWRVVALNDDAALILFGSVEHPTTFSFTKSGGRWTVTGMGGCQAFHTVLAESGRQWAVQTSTGGTAGPLSKTSTTLKVNAMSSVCSDQPPRAVVVEAPDSVTLYLTEPSPTLSSCPAVARTQVVTITLSVPLGSRTLLDGSVWPARPVANDVAGANP